MGWMKSVIKRCPFCGGRPTVDTSDRKASKSMYGDYIDVRQRVVIECTGCFLIKDIVAVRSVSWFDEKLIREVQRDAARTIIENFWNMRW